MNLKSFSAHLGLSQTTVSRALNGYPEVSEKTRQRVLDAAARLGYRPNVSARRLATGRVGAIGIVVPSDGTQLQNPHFSEFIAGLGTHLAKAEFDILVTPTHERDEIAAYKRIAASKRVDAMVLSLPKLQDERIDLLHKLNIPFLLHGRTDSTIPHAWFDIDNEEAFRRATNHLLDLGHTRIALGNGPVGRTYCVHREDGFRNALKARGLSIDQSLIRNGDLTDEAGYAMAEEILQRPDAPTAILTSSIPMALGAFRAMRSTGLVLGRDISMIAHDDVFPYLNAHKMVPSMTTTRSSLREAGVRIGELLLEMLNGREPASIKELWPTQLVLGDSTGPAPKR